MNKHANRWALPLALIVLSVSLLGVGLAVAGQDDTAATSTSDQKGQPKKSDKEAKKDVEAIGDRNVGKGMNFYSLEKEIALGKAMAQQVEQQSRLMQDPVIGEYVNRVGQNIVRNSDAQVPFTIKVLDSDEVNAFALPGGFFYVNSGLILAADTEAELAGVMAHEIAHVAARHGTRQASKAELANWLSLPLIFLGGPAGYGIRSAAGLLIPMKFLQFSRADEREADYLGLQYIYKAGYDPQAFVDFFEELQAKEKSRPGTMAKAFSTHPLMGDRITASESEIKTILPVKSEYVVTTSEFSQVSDRLKVIENRGRVEDEKDQKGKPTLRKTTRKTTTQTASNGSSQGQDKASSDPNATTDPNQQTSDEDQRPTLKRR
jgi:predicted Zn-dependent protease